MFNLFIGYVGPGAQTNPIQIPVSRYLEYTDSETQMRLRQLTGDAVHTIMQYPALFMYEGYAEGAFVGTITSIKQINRAYEVSFEPDYAIGVIPPDVIETAALELDIDSFEFHRTHWAVKQGNLFEILNRHNARAAAIPTVQSPPENQPPIDNSRFNQSQVFIVHGHDEHAKNDVKKYVESRGLEPVILHMQASGGMTIIEKIDHYSNVGFGIVLYTECDLGAKRNSLNYEWRARQNVVFEHGYLIAKLSRSRVAALVKGSVQTPNDISGIVYVDMDATSNWHNEMDKELQQAGYFIGTP
ncbi:MAG: nucleotide-binding protein [Planctomycetota bacterium]